MELLTSHAACRPPGYLDVVSGRTSSPFLKVDLDWTAAQAWTRESNGELVNPKSGLCLTDPNGNTGARLVIATCTDAAVQRWSKPIGTSTGST